MPGQSWLLSQVASPLTLLLLPLCCILLRVSKADVCPYWTGLEIDSLKNNSANKEALSYYAGSFFSCLVNQGRALIQLKDDYQCSTGTLPRACSLHSHTSPIQAAALVQEQAAATSAVTLPKGCSNCASMTLQVKGESQFTKVRFFGLVLGCKKVQSQGHYLMLLCNSELPHKSQEQPIMHLLPHNDLITPCSALQMNHCP